MPRSNSNFVGISALLLSITSMCHKILLQSLHLLCESTCICFLNNLWCHVDSLWSNSVTIKGRVLLLSDCILSKSCALDMIKTINMKQNSKHWVMWGTVILACQSLFQLGQTYMNEIFTLWGIFTIHSNTNGLGLRSNAIKDLCPLILHQLVVGWIGEAHGPTVFTNVDLIYQSS